MPALDILVRKIILLLGQINEWFFNDLAGIGIDPIGAGFRKSIIKPMPAGDIEFVKCSYQTMSGLISTEWKYNNGDFTLKVVIPPNTSATVYIPAKEESCVLESGQRVYNVEGIKFIKIEGDRAVYQVTSGSYQFHSKTK